MKQHSIRRGSVLAFLLLLMFLTMVAIVGIWRSTAFMHDVTLQRGCFVQRSSELEGLLQLGIAWCEDNSDTLFVQPNGTRIVLPVDAWPLGNKQQHGKIECVVSLPYVLVNAHLIAKSGTKRTALCRVHAKKRNKNKSIQLLVDSYFLG